MNQETDKGQGLLQNIGIGKMINALFFAALGFFSNQAFNADRVRLEAQIDRKEGIKEIRKEVRNALKVDLNKAMTICNEAAFRSMETVQKSNESLDNSKESIEKAIGK